MKSCSLLFGNSLNSLSIISSRFVCVIACVRISFLFEDEKYPCVCVHQASQGLSGKGFTCQVGRVGSVPGLGRSLGQGNGNPLQYACLGNSMDRGDWRAAIHGVPENWTRLSAYTAAACIRHIHFSPSLPLIDPWAAFTFCLLWIILLWTWTFTFCLLWIILLWTWTYLSWFLLPVPLCIYSEVKFQNHMLVLVLIFWGATKMFPTAASPL